VLLRHLIAGIDGIEVFGSADIAITQPVLDSRAVESGCVFVAVRGTRVDGHDFIGAAVTAGASAVVCERLPEHVPQSVAFVVTADSSAALGRIASAYHGHPSAQLALVGITGTNGKTTTATLLHGMFRHAGGRAGLLSTIVNLVDDDPVAATHTTGDALQINRLLRRMVDKGCTHCFMEVTSHAIHQNRIAGLRFRGAVFTNFSQDHLDYHLTLEEYFRVKKHFFDALPDTAFALTNVGDPRGLAMVSDTRATVYTYGLTDEVGFRASIGDVDLGGSTLDISGEVVRTRLIGRYNIHNVLAAYATGRLLGMPPARARTSLAALPPVSGRFNVHRLPNGVTGVVDFAHNPDGLDKTLRSLREVSAATARVITVVGCNGDGDRRKRPIMARIASLHSDIVIVTTDDPRSEDPGSIIADMLRGVSDAGRRIIAIPDRRRAIAAAYQLACRDDVVLVAGRGHEKTQHIHGARVPFDDTEVLKEVARSSTGKGQTCAA
jgi:UDP-N-acetylmuramoyl-L-alanyl-D-glutamate--2,6-diaminopimelate ligase